MVTLGHALDPEKLKERGDTQRGRVRVWDVASGKQVASVDSTREVTFGAVLSPDGNRLAVAKYEVVEVLELRD